MLISQLLQEERKNPVPEVGQTTVWDGNEWQLTRIGRDQLGWFWKVIGGRKRPYGNEQFFRYDEPIFNTARYLPKKSQELKPGLNKIEQEEVIKVPEGVVDADTAWEYLRNTNYKPLEALEFFLKTNSRYAALYALNILGKRFYAAEPAIAKDPTYAARYAHRFNLFYDHAKQQFTTSKLDKSAFIKEAAAMPPAAPPVQIAMNKLAQAPEDWYAKLGLKTLEAAHGLPEGLLKHLIAKESSGDPRAVSPRGAKGLFQIMPAHISGFQGDPFNPIEAALYAAKTLRDLANHFDTWEEVLAAYNWGRGNVNRKGLSKAPKETRNYTKFFRSKGIPLGNTRNSVADVKSFENS